MHEPQSGIVQSVLSSDKTHVAYLREENTAGGRKRLVEVWLSTKLIASKVGVSVTVYSNGH